MLSSKGNTKRDKPRSKRNIGGQIERTGYVKCLIHLHSMADIHALRERSKKCVKPRSKVIN
ncbi:hypothetical protein [Wolbachia endosymbiont (group B) of Erebia ligea]|uniref:hypothetical protein n=1 Tax=Wolbachia endosymbiont (group B) of Erebia ligea TaxID=2954010 RepID=UPI003864D1E0